MTAAPKNGDTLTLSGVEAKVVCDEHGGRMGFTVADMDVIVSEESGREIGRIRPILGGGFEIHDRRNSEPGAGSIIWHVTAEALWNAFTAPDSGKPAEPR